MAETLSEFTWPTRGAIAKYPWELWFDGRIWRLTRGTDFENRPVVFRTQALYAAKQRKVVISTAVVGSAVILQKTADVCDDL